MSGYLPNLPETAAKTSLNLQSALNKSNFTTIALTAVVKKVRSLPLAWRGTNIYLQWVNENSVINAALKQNFVVAKFEPVVIKLRLRRGKHKVLQSDHGTSHEGFFKILMKTRNSSSFQTIGTCKMDPERIVQSYIESGVAKRVQRINFENGIKADLCTTIRIIGQNFFTCMYSRRVGEQQKRDSSSAQHASVEDVRLKDRYGIDIRAYSNRLQGDQEDISSSSPMVTLLSDQERGNKTIQFSKSLTDINNDMLRTFPSRMPCICEVDNTQHRGKDGLPEGQ